MRRPTTPGGARQAKFLALGAQDQCVPNASLFEQRALQVNSLEKAANVTKAK
jgi:hypothetical protein